MNQWKLTGLTVKNIWFTDESVKRKITDAISKNFIDSHSESTFPKFKILDSLKVVDPRKLDLRQKQIILLSRIAILLFKGYFGREKINFHEKNLKYRKIILLIYFIFAPTFFLIASY